MCTFSENQRGVSYDSLVGPYLVGAKKITLTDPYIRLFYQLRNLMEFIETVTRRKAPEEEVTVHLVTAEDLSKPEQQREQLERIENASRLAGIDFSWTFDTSGTIHARHIMTDTGWKISLDRGLDIFQRYEMNDAFDLANRLQEFRPCKAFEMTSIRLNA